MRTPRFRKQDDVIVLVKNRKSGEVSALRGRLDSWEGRARNERVELLGSSAPVILQGPTYHTLSFVEPVPKAPKPKRVPMTPEERKARRKELRERKQREAEWKAEDDERWEDD